jgi:hypothetical protein
MDKVAELRLALSRVTYKPGYKITARVYPHVSWPLVQIHTGEIPDSQRPGQTIFVCFSDSYDIEKHSEEYFLDFIRRLFIMFEDHERMEWLKYDGRRLDEPHPERFDVAIQS